MIIYSSLPLAEDIKAIFETKKIFLKLVLSRIYQDLKRIMFLLHISKSNCETSDS